MTSQSDNYDVVVVGAGPVGLVLSTCLARWGYRVKIVDNRAEPTPRGRADGIQPRSLDFLTNMGLRNQLMAHEPAKVYEVAFWEPGSDGIHRTGTWASCPKFIDARYPYTLLLHQGYIERAFIKDLEQNNTQVQRPWTITGFKNHGGDADYPIEVNLQRVEAEEQETVRARYLFSGEGSKSFIRNKLGIKMIHKDPIEHVWGVMDGVVRTDFPDIKMKCTIHSQAGSIMVIPRENNMVRLYIQIASSSDSDWSSRKTANAEKVQKRAKEILQPYSIEWDSVDWFSVYPIGQGISERYTLDERIFLGGDACHTHSPKAGQGMNTAFLDAQNLAWKIHHVEKGFANQDILKSYETERKFVAENLLDFDARYAKLFSARQPAAEEVNSANHSSDDHAKESENEFIKTFKEGCEFTSGYGVAYPTNVFNWSDSHPAAPISKHFLSHGAGTTKLRSGRIMHAATVTRVVDANVVYLEQEVPVNGSWRIYVFAGDPNRTKTALTSFSKHSLQKQSYLTSYLRPDIDTLSPHEKHNPHSFFYSFCVIFNAAHGDVEVAKLCPGFLARYRDHVYADDIWDQRVPDAKAAAHAKMGLSEHTGGIVVVRPDGYVGCVLELTEDGGTVRDLNSYFASFTTKQFSTSESNAVHAQL